MDKCRGCGLCVSACPFGALSMNAGKAFIDYEKCTVCGACASICKKFKAITLQENLRTFDTGRGDVWVFCENDGDRLTHVSLELLSTARTLAADLGVKAAAVLLGDAVGQHAAAVIAQGADLVYIAESAELAEFHDEPYAAVLATLIDTYKPEIFLGGATAVGRALLPRVAVLVHTGLTADCTGLRIDPATKLLLQTRPAFGGNILATITCESNRPQMATVRPAVLRRQTPDPARTGEIIRCKVRQPDLQRRTRWLDFIPKNANDCTLHEAEIIVAAGYGAGGPEGVRRVAQLAEALNGALAASRAVVDAGWLEYSRQVGQTGTTVQPKLYIACGVSGAIQHLVGMQNSETIVAINRDPNAPIFQYADFGIVGDLNEIIPELIRQLERFDGQS